MAVPNFPQPPGRNTGGGGMTFPSDLIASGREFYTEISFVNYEMASSGAGAVMYGGGVKLPMPKRINDNESIIWEEGSLTNSLIQGTNQAASMIGGTVSSNLGRGLGMFGTGLSAIVAGQDLAGAFNVGPFPGQAVNPFQFMMFKRPNFKEYVFNWVLAPNTRQDSDNIKQIVDRCKKAALPSAGSFSGLMKYPDIAMVKFRPDNYLFKLKPCAILGVQVDYTGAGPSFFKSGAPTIVTLTLQLKEIELQKKETYGT